MHDLDPDHLVLVITRDSRELGPLRVGDLLDYCAGIRRAINILGGEVIDVRAYRGDGGEGSGADELPGAKVRDKK